MASLTMAFSPATRRVVVAKATKGTTKGTSEIKEEKGFLDWFLGAIAKEDSLLEVDPILKKVEEKNGGSKKKTVSVAVPPKKNGGFGGLFAKK